MQAVGGNIPSDGKRLRTYFVVRRRYKRARWIAAGGGVLVAAITLTAALTRSEGTDLALDARFLVGAIVLLLVGVGVPGLVVEGLWRWTRWRHFWDWQ